MRKVALCAALGLLARLGHAAESAPPDADFLEYLAEFDTGDDNWTWFAAQDDTDGKDGEKRTTQPPTKQQEKAKP